MNKKAFDSICNLINDSKFTWLVTGGAGFIGSHIADCLIQCSQDVVVVDNLSTGNLKNISYLETQAKKYNSKFKFENVDINDYDKINALCNSIDKVIHQAALGSVPRSVSEPFVSHTANVSGYLSILNAAKANGIKRVVYASSSSVYGDSINSPKVEDVIGKVLSPYAATKLSNEIYADSYANSYGLELVGLRYFNVFGPRQDPNGPYAAVIPRWIDSISNSIPCEIYGDGKTSRDFCYVDNVVYANIASSLCNQLPSAHTVLNIACGSSTSLNELHEIIKNIISEKRKIQVPAPIYKEFRVGDIKHSLASIEKARAVISYEAFVNVKEGLVETLSSC